MAVPLRLDSPLVFHSVSATNCLQKYNIFLILQHFHKLFLTGYKHVIETSGVQHAEKRHGTKSNDRTPLTLEDYLLIPYIIKNRDNVTISTSKTRQRESTVLVYEKQIELTLYYVEEIRIGKKSLAFQTLYKRSTKKPLKTRG